MRRTLSIPMAALLAAACGPGETGPTGVGYMSLPADQVMVGVTQTLNTSGVQAALLRADTVYMHNDSAKADLRSLNLTMYDEHGEIETTVVAESGEIHQITEVMIARGNVVIITEYGQRRVETEELHFDPSRDVMWSDVPFVQTHNGSVTRGSSFRSDGRFGNFEATDFTGRIPGLRFNF